MPRLSSPDPSRQKVTDALRTVHESSSGCIKVLDFHQIYISICQERCTFTASFACTTYVEKKKNKKCVGCLGRISLRRVYTCLLTVWRFVRPFRGLSWIAVPLLTRASNFYRCCVRCLCLSLSKHNFTGISCVGFNDIPIHLVIVTKAAHSVNRA